MGDCDERATDEETFRVELRIEIRGGKEYHEETSKKEAPREEFPRAHDACALQAGSPRRQEERSVS